MAQTLFFLILLLATTNALSNTNNNLTSLKSFCDSTPYPHSCFRSLKHSIGVDTNPNILSHLRTTLATAISESLKLSNLLSAASHNLNIVEKQRGSIQDCRELHQVTVNALRRSVARVNAGGSRRLADARAYLSAALTNQDTCLEGLEPASGPLKPTVVRSVVGIFEHVSNSLSILSRVGAPAGRRLMGFPAKRARRILDDYHAPRKGLTITVAQDGTGNFTTISDAVRFAPSNSYGTIVIFVGEGIYKENLEIPRHKINIILIGSGSEVTVVTGSRSVAGGWTTFRSATVLVSGNGFLARDMGFENTAGPEGHQAVALCINADFVALCYCAITGYQSALYAHSFRQFYRQCNISGTIDYIFGDAAAVFQASNLISRLPTKGQYTVITAQSRASPHSSTGFSLQNCQIIATHDLYSNRSTVRSYLGRPPKAFSRTVVLKSYIDDFIDPSGWKKYSGGDGLETLYYGEYENNGPGSGTENRVGWGGYHHVMDSNDVYNFTVSKFIAGNLWLDSTDFPYDEMQMNCYLE